jgi:neurofibromin 1
MLSRLASSASVFSETAIGTVVGGFFFLRFVCPAFITPDQHGIKADAKLKRGLVLFTKILQNVSNGVLFGAKEPFMEPLNPLLREYLEPVKTFLIDLTVRTAV